MNHPNIDLETYKRNLVLDHVFPAFGGKVTPEPKKIQDIITKSRIIKAIKYQQLEVPGPFSEGHLWISISAMCHSYFYNPQLNNMSGSGIYGKGQFIFNSASLTDQRDRNEYIQILENSEVLSISYGDLIELMEEYKDIKDAVHQLSAKQEYYYRQHISLLNLPSLERVRQFRAQNQSFINCTSQDVQSIHIKLSLRAYINKIKELR